MNQKIFVDHCYNVDQGHKFFKKLGKLGFTLDKNIMEHPGKAYCKFIIFKGDNPRKRFYLEFVSIGKGGSAFLTPGLSFGFESKLALFHKKINSKLPSKFWHKNFQWKENSQDHLPGWNFIEFNKPIIKDTNIWFTEYEISDKRKKLKVPNHKNAISSLHGIILTVTPTSKKKLEILLGSKIKDHKVLMDGVTIYLKNGKRDQFESIILNSDNLEKSKEVIGRSGKKITILGEEMLQIQPPKNKNVPNWNLLVRNGSLERA